MAYVITRENREQFDDLLTQMWEQRASVFVDTLGWDLPTAAGLEVDDYDDDRATYIVTTDGDQVVSSLRLLPTTGPHLMSDLFPNFCDDGPPTGDDVWEISRFYALPTTGGTKERVDISARTLLAAVELAILHDVRRLSMLTGMATTRITARMGFDIDPLGLPTQHADGQTYIASTLAATIKVSQFIRYKHGILGASFHLGSR